MSETPADREPFVSNPSTSWVPHPDLTQKPLLASSYEDGTSSGANPFADPEGTRPPKISKPSTLVKPRLQRGGVTGVSGVAKRKQRENSHPVTKSGVDGEQKQAHLDSSIKPLSPPSYSTVVSHTPSPSQHDPNSKPFLHSVGAVNVAINTTTTSSQNPFPREPVGHDPHTRLEPLRYTPLNRHTPTEGATKPPSKQSSTPRHVLGRLLSKPLGARAMNKANQGGSPRAKGKGQSQPLLSGDSGHRGINARDMGGLYAKWADVRQWDSSETMKVGALAPMKSSNGKKGRVRWDPSLGVESPGSPIYLKLEGRDEGHEDWGGEVIREATLALE